MHIEVRLSVLQWGCCPMSSYLQAQKYEILGSRGATEQCLSPPLAEIPTVLIHLCIIFLLSQREEQDEAATAHTQAQTTSCASACWSYSGTDIYLNN